MISTKLPACSSRVRPQNICAKHRGPQFYARLVLHKPRTPTPINLPRRLLHNYFIISLHHNLLIVKLFFFSRKTSLDLGFLPLLCIHLLFNIPRILIALYKHVFHNKAAPQNVWTRGRCSDRRNRGRVRRFQKLILPMARQASGAEGEEA